MVIDSIPPMTALQVARAAILVTLDVLPEDNYARSDNAWARRFRRWASSWLDGSDRSFESARLADAVASEIRWAAVENDEDTDWVAELATAAATTAMEWALVVRATEEGKTAKAAEIDADLRGGLPRVIRFREQLPGDAFHVLPYVQRAIAEEQERR